MKSNPKAKAFIRSIEISSKNIRFKIKSSNLNDCKQTDWTLFVKKYSLKK